MRDCGLVSVPNTPSNWSRTPVQTPSKLPQALVSGAATATVVRSQASTTLAPAKMIPDRMMAAGTSRFSFTRRRCQPSWRSTSAARSQRSRAAMTKSSRWPNRLVKVADRLTIIAAPSSRIASITRLWRYTA